MDSRPDNTRQKLLPPEVAVPLLCAAVRQAAEAGVSLRPRLLKFHGDGQVSLDLSQASAGAEDRPGYVAPEVVAGLCPLDDPRALVYAAGALGFELLTGSPIPDRRFASDKPLAAVLARALAPAHQRFASLDQLALELEKVHPPPQRTPQADVQHRPHLAPQAAREAEAPAVPDRSGDPQAQLAAAHARIAWLEQSLVQQRNEANGREERLKRTIAVLQQRTDALTRLASAAADRPGEAAAADSTPRPLAPRWLLIGAAAISAAAIAFATLALRDIAQRERIARARLPLPPAVTPQRPAGFPAETPIEPGPLDAEQAAPANERSQAGAERTAPSRAAAAHPARSPSVRQARTARSELDRGERALVAGRPEEALAAFQSALSLEPRLADAIKGLAAAYMQLGEPEKARQHYERYLELAPNAPDADRIRRLLAQFHASNSSG
ncbi:MAG TPA: tetratricopeptide repeat protein [Myxococcales bacterium]|nr:tetratricopeptide repeat protein [Myxococcales bacterium]